MAPFSRYGWEKGPGPFAGQTNAIKKNGKTKYSSVVAQGFTAATHEYINLNNTQT